MRRGRSRFVGALSFAVAVTLTLGFGAVSASATNPTFPSWADVLAAEKNAAAKKAEIAKITKLISGLQSESADSGKTALLAGEKYDEAENSLAKATAAATKLSTQAAEAKKKAKASSREAGQLAAQLAREGYGNIALELFLNSRGASNLLDRLGTMSKLSEASAHIFATAQQDHNAASSLSGQASIARAAEAKKASAAKADYAVATGAASASKSRVTAESSQEKVLIAQLASLNGTTASIETQYLAGVAWEKKQAAQKTPPKSPPPPPSEPGAPVSTKVAVAIAFARAQLGKPYVLGGFGPNAWDCSGLTKAAWAAAGVNIGPHGSTSQYTFLKGENRLVPIGDRQPGDLLFYSDGGSTTATKYHVTLYIGNGEMIEAPYPGVNVRIAAVRYGDLVPYAARPTG
jgi:cell wall-associated NlpC family hydrolase